MLSAAMLFRVGACVLYLVAVWCAARAARAAVRVAHHEERRWWTVIASLFGVLALSRGLGIEEAFRQALRSRIMAAGLYQHRWEYQSVLASAVILCITGAAAVFYVRWTQRQSAWRGRRTVRAQRLAQVTGLAQAASGAMVTLVLLRLVSIHAVDSLLYRGPHLNWLVDIGATLAVIGLGLTYHRSAAELEGERGMRSQRSGTDEAVDRRRKP